MADTVSSKSTNDDHNSTVLAQDHTKQDTGTDERYEVGGADAREITFWNQKRTGDLHQTMDIDGILAKRRNDEALSQQQMRHTEDLHKQALRHAETEHVIKVQTLQVGSVGNSRIIEDIASDAANRIVALVNSKK